MDSVNFLSGESDGFVGRRVRFKRYLVVSLAGYFPVLTRTGPETLAIVYRTGGVHVEASATVAVARSRDGGRSWSDPVEVTPRWNNDANPSFGVNARGELVLAFWRARLHAWRDGANGPEPAWGPNGYAEAVKEAWGKVPALFTCRSADGGATWTTPRSYTSGLLSTAVPHGHIVTAPDGTLCMPVYGALRERGEPGKDAVIVLRSRDGGVTWGDESLVTRGYNETNFAFLPRGRMVAASRSTSGHTAILFSDDLGRNWTEPKPLTRDGEHPGDLTLLRSGRLLLTFGRRIRPMGCGLLLSADGGETWNRDREVLLAGDGVRSSDLGYPSTVQLEDGRIVTALYYASGSEMSRDTHGWGDVSCQVVHYREEDIS